MYDIVSGPRSKDFGISVKYLGSIIDTYLCTIGTKLTSDQKPMWMVIIKPSDPIFGISVLSELNNNHYLPMYNRYREDTFSGSGILIYFLLVSSCLGTSCMPRHKSIEEQQNENLDTPHAGFAIHLGLCRYQWCPPSRSCIRVALRHVIVITLVISFSTYY